MKALIIEDEEFILTSISRIVNKEGFSVLTAQDYEKAMEIIATHKLNLIISDVMLPFPEGFDIVDFIKNDPIRKQIPVILVTGMDEDILKATCSKADDYIIKPFTSQQLKKLISKYCLKKVS